MNLAVLTHLVQRQQHEFVALGVALACAEYPHAPVKSKDHKLTYARRTHVFPEGPTCCHDSWHKSHTRNWNTLFFVFPPQLSNNNCLLL